MNWFREPQTGSSGNAWRLLNNELVVDRCHSCANLPFMAPLPSNCRLFILFRLFFNARLYYPVLGILFLDLGLSLEQYALLNVIWAVAIVVLEVPSGAIADLIGRRRMVVLAAVLMVCEMALFAFAPADHPELLFWLLALNRILSGAAEASASGADEALAYDSLADEGRGSEWPRVLEILMRWQSLAFFFAMVSGAVLYDAGWVNAILGFIGAPAVVTPEMSLRFPLYATLFNSFVVLACALAMRESGKGRKTTHPTVGGTLRQTADAGLWIVRHHSALALILTGLVFDSMIRLVLTVNSNYYRFLGIPEGFFGMIGAGMALVGFAAAPIAKAMAARGAIVRNFSLLAVITLSALVAMALIRHPLALLVLIPIGFSMQSGGFLLSTYLNAEVESERRATVLSFRGLAYNIGYGVIGLAYAALSAAQKQGAADANEVFGRTLPWFPAWFTFTLLLLGAFLLVRRSQRIARPNPSRE